MSFLWLFVILWFVIGIVVFLNKKKQQSIAIIIIFLVIGIPNYYFSLPTISGLRPGDTITVINGVEEGSLAGYWESSKDKRVSFYPKGIILTFDPNSLKYFLVKPVIGTEVKGNPGEIWEVAFNRVNEKESGFTQTFWVEGVWTKKITPED